MKMLYPSERRDDYWKSSSSSRDWWEERTSSSSHQTTSSQTTSTPGGTTRDLDDVGKNVADTLSDNVFLTSALAAAMQAVFGFLGYTGRAMGVALVRIIDRRFPHE